jgi:hypothetical protein
MIFFSHFSEISVPAMWSVIGIGFLLFSVALLRCLSWRIASIFWASWVLEILLSTGPLVALVNGGWSTEFDFHSTIWGVYASTFSLDAGSNALVFNGVLLIVPVALLHHNRYNFSRTSVLIPFMALRIGLTANTQTYALLFVVIVVAYFAELSGLSRAESRVPLVNYLLVRTLSLVLSPRIRNFVGELPVYALSLSARVPGAVVLFSNHLRLFVVSSLVFGIEISPQVIETISGTLSGNDFLAYRGDQSVILGIQGWSCLLLGTAIL